MKKMPLLLMLSILLTGRMASAQTTLSPSDERKFFIQLEQNLGKFPKIESKFIQEKHLSLFKDVLVSHGLFAFAAPDRLRWEITKPFHSLLVMKGREVSKYDFPDGVHPHPLPFPAGGALGEVLQQIADIHQGRFDAQGKNYSITVIQDKNYRVILVPEDPRLRKIIEKIEIGFSVSLDRVASVVIREKGGDFTRITFEKGPRDPQLSDRLFSIP
jgi:hypothetical protein